MTMLQTATKLIPTPFVLQIGADCVPCAANEHSGAGHDCVPVFSYCPEPGPVVQSSLTTAQFQAPQLNPFLQLQNVNYKLVVANPFQPNKATQRVSYYFSPPDLVTPKLFECSFQVVADDLAVSLDVGSITRHAESTSDYFVDLSRTWSQTAIPSLYFQPSGPTSRITIIVKASDDATDGAGTFNINAPINTSATIDVVLTYCQAGRLIGWQLGSSILNPPHPHPRSSPAFLFPGNP